MRKPPHPYGYIRADGFIFRGSVPKRNGKGEYTGEYKDVWLSPAAFHRDRVQAAVRNCKSNALRDDYPFDLTVEYMLSIFPKDGLCPILGVRMQWGDAAGRPSSPSIDKRNPARGYVRGNVAWISSKANRMKAESTVRQIRKILAYLEPDQVLFPSLVRSVRVPFG